MNRSAAKSPRATKQVIHFTVDPDAGRGVPSPEEIMRARAAVEAVLSRLAALDGRIVLNFGAGETLMIASEPKPCILAASQGEPPDCVVEIHPFDLERLIGGTMDVRHALFYNRYKVHGSMPIAMRFGDLIGNKGLRLPPSLPGLLPVATRSLEQARRDLAKFGYALVADSINPETVVHLRNRLFDQAAAEHEHGIALFDGGPTLPNQRVLNLINKGREFVELLDNPIIDGILPHFLGEHFLISSYTGNIAGPGGEPMALHMDQIQIAPPIDAFPVGINIAWFLDDVTEENGGTRLMPCSHDPRYAPANPFSIEDTIAATGPAGTALLFESRLWHATGANRTSMRRPVLLLYIVRYFVRPQENAFLSLAEEVEPTLSHRIRVMLGFRATHSLGGVDGAIIEGTMAVRGKKPVPRMDPSGRRRSRR